MNFTKVIYNNETEFILEIINKHVNSEFLELYNISYRKDKRKAKEILERHGTKNVPLIVFEDENLEEASAIWSESNPDWEKEIINKLNND